MKFTKQRKEAGFSLIEMLIVMVVTIMLLSLVSLLMTSAFGTRQRESQRTDALSSSKTALNIMSREVSNAGFGLTSNGLIVADSDAHKLRFRTNVDNTDSNTNSPGEDVTYYYDSINRSIVRYDPHDSPQNSVVINQVSEVTFNYFDYSGSSSTPTQQSIPSNNTGKIRITVTVQMDNVGSQMDDQTISFVSEVTLRNSKYMLNIY